MLASFSDLGFVAVVIIVPGITLLFIFAAWVYFYRRTCMVRKNVSEDMIIQQTEWSLIENNNWVWPELLNRDIGAVYRENREDKVQASKTGCPRQTPSMMEIASVHHRNPMFIYQKTKLIRSIGSILKAESGKKVYDEENMNRMRFKSRKDADHFVFLRSLQHSNILLIQHIYFDYAYCHTFYSYTQRGTIEDVLLCRRYSLNQALKFSFMNDLIQGLFFIQQNLKFHGNLSTKYACFSLWSTLKG